MDAESKTRTITLQLDEDDYRSLNEAIAHYQRTDHAAFGETMLPEGDSCMKGAIVGEICRAYLEYNDWFAANFPKDTP